MAHADTHGCECMLLARLPQFQGRCSNNASARSAQWMTQRDGPTVRVHMRRIVGQSEIARHRQDLRRAPLCPLIQRHIDGRDRRRVA